MLTRGWIEDSDRSRGVDSGHGAAERVPNRRAPRPWPLFVRSLQLRSSEQWASELDTFCVQHHFAFLSRTPEPPPFSAMNSTPAASRARWIAVRVEAFGSALPLSILIRPVFDIPARSANSLCFSPSMARAPLI